EAPRQRRLAGKPAIGLVSLMAREEGGAVRLTVADDGAGIDRAMLAGRFRIRAAGPDEAGLPETIVRPPGPASEAADRFTGGGTGRDIVTRAAERLGGSVGLRSERGVGTAMSLLVPRTLMRAGEGTIPARNIRADERREPRRARTTAPARAAATG